MATANQQPPVNQNQATSKAEENALRILRITYRIHEIFDLTGKSSDELPRLFIRLARCIDYAISVDNIPHNTLKVLPSTLKQVCQHRKEETLQPSIALLMIATKNACRNSWFRSGDCEELLVMSNELLASFCLGNSITTDEKYAVNTISELIRRFYPQLKLGRMFLSLEVKPGFQAVVSDFLIERSTRREDSIRLIVVQTDDLKTSSCLINPPQMSFLVNGKAVAGRTNVYLDKGPQLPTDITRMLKYGTNLFQTIGYSSGKCLVALALMSTNACDSRPKLKEYVEAHTNTTDLDSEILEGPSKVSLNCPISLKRIRMPVKGYLCKHLQCFDYDNFVEMNFVMPTWRCPFCIQPTSFVDLRLDLKLANILADVPEDATAVVVSSDGSYEVIFDKDESQHQDESTNSKYTVNSQSNAVDLTTDEDGKNIKTAIEICETKPFEHCQNLPSTRSLSQQQTSNHANVQGIGTLESLVPNSILNPIDTNTTQNTRRSLPINVGMPPVAIQEHPTHYQSVYPSHHLNTGYISQNQSGMQQVEPTWPYHQFSSSLNVQQTEITQPPRLHTINPGHTSTANAYLSQGMMIPPSINISDTINQERLHPASSVSPGESVFDNFSRLLAYQRLNNQNWQPLGTMRGGLTGNSYNIARNQYSTLGGTNVNADTSLSSQPNWRHMG